MSPLGTFSPGVFWPGGFLSGGTFVQGAYARSPQFQWVYALSRLSVPSMIYVYPAGGCIQLTYQERGGQKYKKNRQTNKIRQTRPRSSAESRPTLPKFSGYVEVDAHYIFHPSTIWVRPLFTELGPKKTPFCHKANKYMSPQQRHNNVRSAYRPVSGLKMIDIVL